MPKSCLTAFFLLLCAALHAQPFAFTRDTLTWTDTARHRAIPVALYLPQKPLAGSHVVVFSHGYGENQPGSYLGYTYLTEFLAARGYVVVSIQHELPTDSLLPMGGVIRQVRRTNWERGAENIRFVLNTLQRLHPDWDHAHTALIGHSNGGDQSMLLATLHPERVECVLSLDNRRVPLPRTAHPRIASLRSSDQPADEGTLPTADEQRQFGIQVVLMQDMLHNDMDAPLTEAKRTEIQQFVLAFLRQ